MRGWFTQSSGAAEGDGWLGRYWNLVVDLGSIEGPLGCPPVFPRESFDPREVAMIEGGDGETMGGGGRCDEEVEVSDLLPNLLLACLHFGETLPNIRASFQDFETVFQQLAVAAPEAFTSDREQAPLDFGCDNDAGKAGSISDFFPALKSRLVGGLFQGLRKDRGIKKPFHEDSLGRVDKLLRAASRSKE
jgi:hypothetical protein